MPPITPLTPPPKVNANIRIVVEVASAAILLVALLYYLLAPVYLFEATPNTPYIPQPSENDYLLHCYLVRDASLSASKVHYDALQQAILGNLSTQAGDRISYALFGSDTKPNPIEPPSNDAASIAAQLGGSASYTTTDFAFLFQRLREAIYADRRTRPSTQRTADAIVILSDGIPDLSTHESGCPDGHSDLLSPSIVKKFDALLNSSYPTQEPIYVRLVLVGAPKLCGPKIKQEWEAGLKNVPGAQAFQVVSSGDVHDVENQLLQPLRRQPRIILSLAPPTDHERMRLDQDAEFAVQYSARSFRLNKGELRIDYGTLIPRHDQRDAAGVRPAASNAEPREVRLLAVKDPALLYTDPESRVVIPVRGPPAGRLLGEATKSSIYFKLETSQDKALLSEYQGYDLRLKLISESVTEILPATLSMPPCSQANKKQELKTKLRYLTILPTAIGVIFLAGFIVWLPVINNPNKAEQPIYKTIERILVTPYRRWIEALLIVAVPMTIATLFIQPIAVIVCIGLLAGLLLFFMKSFESSATAKLLFFTIEFIVLRLIHLLIANHR